MRWHSFIYLYMYNEYFIFTVLSKRSWVSIWFPKKMKKKKKPTVRWKKNCKSFFEYKYKKINISNFLLSLLVRFKTTRKIKAKRNERQKKNDKKENFAICYLVFVHYIFYFLFNIILEENTSFFKFFFTQWQCSL